MLLASCQCFVYVRFSRDVENLYVSIEQSTSIQLISAVSTSKLYNTHDELPRAINVERRFTKAIVGLDDRVQSKSGN